MLVPQENPWNQNKLILDKFLATADIQFSLFRLFTDWMSQTWAECFVEYKENIFFLSFDIKKKKFDAFIGAD